MGYNKKLFSLLIYAEYFLHQFASCLVCKMSEYLLRCFAFSSQQPVSFYRIRSATLKDRKERELYYLRCCEHPSFGIYALK